MCGMYGAGISRFMKVRSAHFSEWMSRKKQGVICGCGVCLNQQQVNHLQKKQ